MVGLARWGALTITKNTSTPYTTQECVYDGHFFSSKSSSQFTSNNGIVTKTDSIDTWTCNVGNFRAACSQREMYLNWKQKNQHERTD